MGLAHRLRLAGVLASLAACVLPLSVAAQGWDTWRGLYPTQNYAAQVALQQHVSQSWNLPSHQIKTMPTVSYPVPLQPLNSGAIAPHPGGGAIVARGIQGPGPGGGVIDVDVRQVIPKRKIAERVISSLPIVGTAAAVALTIKDILDEARVMEGPGGTILMDPGQPEQMLTTFRVFRPAPLAYDSGYIFESAEAACSSALAVCNAVSSPGGTSAYCTRISPNSCDYQVTVVNADGSTSNGGVLSYSTGSRTALQCPPGQIVSFWADDWCTTKPDDWTPATEEQATDRIEPKIVPGAAPQVVRELDEQGIGVEGDLPSVQGPSAIHGGRETTVNPDGSTTVKDTWNDIRYGPMPAPGGLQAPGWEWSRREETRTFPPGEPIPAPEEVVGPPDESVTQTPGAGGGTSLEDLITCGLPWTPPCKIDETGTPTAPPDTSQQDAQDGISGIADCLANPAACLPQLELSWSFSLPSGCTPFEIPGYDMMPPLDICQWQPVIHDLMSLLWVAAGLFGAIRMVNREMFGGA